MELRKEVIERLIADLSMVRASLLNAKDNPEGLREECENICSFLEDIVGSLSYAVYAQLEKPELNKRIE